MDVHAHLLELPSEDAAGGGIELRVHQVRHQVDDVDLEAAFSRPRAASRPSSPPPMTTARVRDVSRAFEHAVAVVERAEDEDAVLERRRSSATQSVDRRHQRAAAGGDDQRVVRFDDAVGAATPASGRRRCVSTRSPACRTTPLLRVPRQRVDDDVLGLVAAGQHAREQDAVVVAVRLVAEHGDRRTRPRPPRASTSSTSRAPAMPLPTTTRRRWPLMSDPSPRRRRPARRTP